MLVGLLPCTISITDRPILIYSVYMCVYIIFCCLPHLPPGHYCQFNCAHVKSVCKEMPLDKGGLCRPAHLTRSAREQSLVVVTHLRPHRFPTEKARPHEEPSLSTHVLIVPSIAIYEGSSFSTRLNARDKIKNNDNGHCLFISSLIFCCSGECLILVL